MEDSRLEAIMVGSGQTLFRIQHQMFGGFLTESVSIHSLRKIGALAHDPISGKIKLFWRGLLYICILG